MYTKVNFTFDIARYIRQTHFEARCRIYNWTTCQQSR